MAGIDDKYGFVAFEVSQNEIKGRFMALSKALTNADAIAADEFAYSAKPILLANGQTIALGNIGTAGHP
jgi:disulfide oxidoreductase YuzD